MAIGTPSKLLCLLLVGTFFFGDTSGSCNTVESDSILHNCLVDLIFYIRATPCNPPCDVYNATVLCINNLTLTVNCRSTMEDEVDETVALFGSVCTFDDFKVLCPLATLFDVPNETTTVIFSTDGDTTMVDTTVHAITTMVDTTVGESNTGSSKITGSTLSPASHSGTTFNQLSHSGTTSNQLSHTDTILSQSSHTDTTLSQPRITEFTSNQLSNSDSTLSQSSITDKTLSQPRITESTSNPLRYTDSTLSQQGHTGSTLTQHSHTSSGMPVSTSPIDSSTQDNGADTAPRINTLSCFMLVIFASVIISLLWS